MQTAQWRLIINSQPVSGTLNMAIDEAIFELMDSGKTPPTLRLYAWDPPCLSLGTMQPVAEVDFGSLTRRGWDLVRRPTGGRAILHTDELTYSIAGPTSDPRLAGTVLESYARLSQALLKALELLSLEVAIKEGSSNNSKRPSPVCFEVPSNYEITIGGKKLLGSAQARRRSNLLQHGSLPLCGDLTRITQGLVFEDEAARLKAAERLLQRAATVEMISRKPVSWKQAAQAFITGFESALNLSLTPGELSAEEHALSKKLCKEKYASASWTHRA